MKKKPFTWFLSANGKSLPSFDLHQKWFLVQAYEDFKFWLSSVEAQFGDTSFGNDLATVTNQKKRHTYFEEDVRLHEELLLDLNKLADECILAEQFDPKEVTFIIIFFFGGKIIIFKDRPHLIVQKKTKKIWN